MKNLNYFFTLICFLSGLFLSCQTKVSPLNDYPTYYRNSWKVSDLLKEGKFNEGMMKFDSIAATIKHVPSSHLFKMARLSAEHNNCDLTKKYLLKAIENGDEYGKGIRSHKTIIGCELVVNEVLSQEIQIHKTYFNFEYKAKIDSMFEADQEARTNQDNEKMRQIDSTNMYKLLQLIEEFGYPGEKIIGNKSAFNAFIMLLHMDRDTNNKVFGPILRKAYSEGALWPSGYAWIVDRRRSWGEERLEPYYYHMPSSNYKGFSDEQKKIIDIRRDSIGLRPK